MRLWSLLKVYSLFGHMTGFFFSFFFFLIVGSVPESLRVRETADICLLKLRTPCFSWSNMSGLRCNTSDHSPLKEFKNFQEQIIY